jgi:hypothetical protein
MEDKIIKNLIIQSSEEGNDLACDDNKRPKKSMDLNRKQSLQIISDLFKYTLNPISITTGKFRELTEYLCNELGITENKNRFLPMLREQLMDIKNKSRCLFQFKSTKKSVNKSKKSKKTKKSVKTKKSKKSL